MKRTQLTLIATAIASTMVATAYAAGPANTAQTGTQQSKVANHNDSTQPVKDAYLKGKVMGALAFNTHVSAFDIDVKVDNGVAYLGGAVDSDVERDLAVEITRGIEDITEVRSEITIKPGTRMAREQSRRSLGQRADDAGTTASVKTKLLANQSTSGLAINVTTKSGVVTLTGKAKSAAESDLATRIAENTTGVVDVRNDLVLSKR